MFLLGGTGGQLLLTFPFRFLVEKETPEWIEDGMPELELELELESSMLFIFIFILFWQTLKMTTELVAGGKGKHVKFWCVVIATSCLQYLRVCTYLYQREVSRLQAGGLLV